MEQSNGFINAVSARLADPATERSVDRLTRLVIQSALLNTVSSYDVQILFLRLKDDLGARDEMRDFLAMLVENAELAVARLAGTPYAALPQNAKAANQSVQALTEEFIRASEDLLAIREEAGSRMATLQKSLIEDGTKALSLALGRVTGSYLVILITVGASAIVFFALNYLIGRQVLKPILATTGMLKEIASGSGDLSRRISVDSDDEAGDLARYFNDFVQALNLIIVSMKKSGVKNREFGVEIASHAEEMSATLEQIAASMQMMKQRAEELKANVERASSDTSSINQRMSAFAGNVESQERTIGETTARVEALIDSIRAMSALVEEENRLTERMADSAMEAGSSLERNQKAIGEIESAAGIIRQAIGVINDVAEQTNLLAMNAAIEAAHAGGEGKGFAVVAGEIRKLAQATSENAKDISRSLGAINEKIDNAMKSSASTQKTVEQIIGDISDNHGSVSTIREQMMLQLGNADQLGQGIGTLNASTMAVHADMAAVSGSMASIEGFHRQIDGQVAETLYAIAEISQGSSEIAKAMNQLAGLGTDNSRLATELNRQIGQFRTLEE